MPFSILRNAGSNVAGYFRALFALRKLPLLSPAPTGGHHCAVVWNEGGRFFTFSQYADSTSPWIHDIRLFFQLIPMTRLVLSFGTSALRVEAALRDIFEIDVALTTHPWILDMLRRPYPKKLLGPAPAPLTDDERVLLDLFAAQPVEMNIDEAIDILAGDPPAPDSLDDILNDEDAFNAALAKAQNCVGTWQRALGDPDEVVEADFNPAKAVVALEPQATDRGLRYPSIFETD